MRGNTGYLKFVKYACHEMRIQSAVIDDNQYILVIPIQNREKSKVLRPPALLISAAILWNKGGYVQLEAGRLLAHTPAGIWKFLPMENLYSR
jgi:hypothetical protein